MFYKNENLALIIDGPSTHSAAMQIDMHIDWQKLRKEFENRGQLLRAIYATPMFEDDGEHNPLQPLVDWLEYNGFTMITRIAKKEADENGRFRVRNGSLLVNITLSAIQLAKKVNHIVLFTGDGSYEPLIVELQRMNVRVSVCCSKLSTADCLRRAADHFINLEDLRGMVGKEDNGR